jgi:integrase
MTTAVPSAALATIQPVFTDAGRIALAGFLAGYRGLLALNGLRVSEATGADIEHLGLERGHRTLTITTDLCGAVRIPR